MDEGVRSVGPSGVFDCEEEAGCDQWRRRWFGFEEGFRIEEGRWGRRRFGFVMHWRRALRKGVGRGIGRRNEEGLMGGRTNLEVFEFNEYDGVEGQTVRRSRFGDGVIRVEYGERRYGGSAMQVPRTGIKREFETGSSRHLVDKRKSLYHERTGSLGRGDRGMYGDGGQLPLARDKFVGVSDEPIRVQGKNGVLKVMVKKKKNNVPGPLGTYIFPKAEEHGKAPRSEDIPKKNAIIPPFFAEPKPLEKPILEL